MDVYIGADHGGYQIKEQLKPFLRELGYNPIDIGNTEIDPADDYPDVGERLKEAVEQNTDKDNLRAVLICGSGIGMSIAANKIRGVRAVLGGAPENAYFARLHNDANVLCLSGLKSNSTSIERVIDGDYRNLIDAGMTPANLNEAKRIVKVFLETATEAVPGSRHRRRVEKIGKLEGGA
jgi:RpiB/LacA/LacB family sugar-phosphate isomerase